ncbi:amylosucrase [Mediterraneibacter glycyrrhizinilyticus]|uniref:amylosucrase n=1 Tax=Mediterraneibacter glycyrrhizinilyticus TaxID=342942 RepID=UPI0025AA672D|nr:amylosucrase [Mediterraneibacter glycyrrhizinilyticus]MDN0059909.1 amylosucrase [Mediterraneibacter glycyrrhizinilyticus]
MAKKSRTARKKQAAADRKTVTAAQNVKKAPAVEAVKEETAAVKAAEEAEAAEAARKAAEEEAKAAEAARKAEEEAKAAEAARKAEEEAKAAETARKAEEEAKAAEAARKAEEEAKAAETARKAEEEAKAAEEAKKEENDRIFAQRLERHHDEFRWLYMELYGNDDMFAELCDQMKRYYDERNDKLKTLDAEREAEGEWYRKRDMLGMMMYIDNFAGNIKGVQEKLPYLEKCNVNYVHLMPFLDSPKGRSDGGYAVADFRKVKPELGTMEDLSELAEKCHEKGISLCMDFVMNHTSEDHEWAVKARQGDGEYMSRYFFYADPSIPQEYEKTVPQVFPTTAPGNFTYLPELGHYVMTTFYPYQWDLNYRNPRVFNEMMYNFLYLANQGMDIIRIDAVPYIWKELGTNCRNLPQVHTIVRMMRMIGEIVCPGIVLLGEVVMEPDKVAPYFGTVEKPECHMLYNVTTMATTWNTVATRDIRLLRKQMDIVCALPREYTFLNYLRCHDDIGWGLDYDTLKTWGMEEVPHKKYLNDYFQGKTEGSVSRGELYNEDLVTGDARFCATTASMCGVESAGFEQDEQKMDQAITKDVMLHAYMFTQSGIPMLYSGDEIGQVNDYTYKDDPEKAPDSRYIHRGKFNWDLVDNIENKESVQGKIFQALDKLEAIRRNEAVFNTDAEVYTKDYSDQSVLWIIRRAEGEELHAVFNFSDYPKTIWMPETAEYTDLLTGKKAEVTTVDLPGWGFFWMKKKL